MVLWYFGNPHIPNFFGSITPSISHTAQEAHTTIIIERSVLTSPGVSLKQKSLCILSKSFFVDLIYNRNECLHQGCCYPRKPQIIWTMKTLTLTNNILINLTIFTFNAPRYLWINSILIQYFQTIFCHYHHCDHHHLAKENFAIKSWGLCYLCAWPADPNIFVHIIFIFVSLTLVCASVRMYNIASACLSAHISHDTRFHPCHFEGW